MNKKSITKLVDIKKVISKDKNAMQKYYNLLKMCETSEDLIETLLEMKFSLLQAAIVMDLILIERSKVEDTIYRNIFNSVKTNSNIH